MAKNIKVLLLKGLTQSGKTHALNVLFKADKRKKVKVDYSEIAWLSLEDSIKLVPEETEVLYIDNVVKGDEMAVHVHDGLHVIAATE